MKLPPFVFITPNKNDTSMGGGFILHSYAPYELGRVIKLAPSPYSISEYKNKFNPLIMAEVDGFSIVISYAGNLSGYKVQVSGPDWEQELQKVFDKMAKFFYEEKILFNQGYYRRYKL